MTPDPSTDDMRELLGAYALNALDLDERARVDAFLLTDPEARAELHELEHAAAWLGHASLRPPAGAWDAIAAEVERELNDFEPVPAPEITPETTPEPAPGVTPISARPSRGARWLVAAAVAVLALGAAAGVVALADRTDQHTDSTAAQARDALRDPSATEATLRSDDGRWSARVVVLPNRTGYLRAVAMPETEAGHDLQLWSLTPDGPVSAGLLRGSDVWHEFRAADATTAIAVTEEPRGGSPSPTGNPIVTGELGSA
jgi:anti-sigma-K factor RskA